MVLTPFGFLLLYTRVPYFLFLPFPFSFMKMHLVVQLYVAKLVCQGQSFVKLVICMLKLLSFSFLLYNHHTFRYFMEGPTYKVNFLFSRLYVAGMKHVFLHSLVFFIFFGQCFLYFNIILLLRTTLPFNLLFLCQAIHVNA